MEGSVYGAKESIMLVAPSSTIVEKSFPKPAYSSYSSYGSATPWVDDDDDFYENMFMGRNRKMRDGGYSAVDGYQYGSTRDRKAVEGVWDEFLTEVAGLYGVQSDIYIACDFILTDIFFYEFEQDLKIMCGETFSDYGIEDDVASTVTKSMLELFVKTSS